MHNCVVHSNESAYRKSGHLGMQQVLSCIELQALEVPLEGLEYDAKNKDFYLKLF